MARKSEEFSKIIEEVKNLSYPEQIKFLFISLGSMKANLEHNNTSNGEIISTYAQALELAKEIK